MSTVLHTVIKRSAKDVRCIRIVVGISSICLWIGFLTTAVSFFSPPWITWEVARPVPNVGVVNVRVHIGLVSYCKYQSHKGMDLKNDCTWFRETERETPVWMVASRGLVGVACCLTLVTTLTSLFICKRKFQNAECSSFIIAGSFLSLSAIVAAVVTFGIKAADDYEAEFLDRTANVYLDWGFYLAIIGAGLSLIGLVVISCAVYYTSTDASDYGKVINQNGNYLYMDQKI